MQSAGCGTGSRRTWVILQAAICLLHSALASPQLVWQATYDGPSHGEDKVTGLATDPSGNCYLTGYSYGDTTDYDFATVCVNASGRTVWASRYGSPLHCEDRPWCLARDSAGNVIASGGTIADFSVGWDYQTIKYAPAGDVVWLRRQDFAFHYDDKPAAMSVGPGNSLVIAGASRRRPVPAAERQPSAENRTDWDISLVKYAPSGDTVWTRLYDGQAGLDDYAAAIAVDEQGNCYVAGKTTTRRSTDIALLKFRSDGSLAWHREIDGAGHSADMAACVLLDHAGHVYVVGSVTGAATSFDYEAACFDTGGRLAWQRQYDAAGRVDIAAAACLDPEGNLVVTGQSTGNATSFDIATVKYSPAGGLLWARRYNGPRNAADRGWCVATDRHGQVVVGGNSVGATSYPDLLLTCYSPGGDSLWTFRYSGTGAGEARPVAIQVRTGPPSEAADAPPRLLVAGYASMAQTGFDYLLLLVDPDGRREQSPGR